MKRTRESKRKAPSAESIARMADRGEDVSRFFTNCGESMGVLSRLGFEHATGPNRAGRVLRTGSRRSISPEPKKRRKP